MTVEEIVRPGMTEQQLSEAVNRSLADIRSSIAGTEGAARDAVLLKLDPQIADLKRDLSALQQAQALSKAPDFDAGEDRHLKLRFTDEDGQVRALGDYRDGSMGSSGLFDSEETYGDWHAELQRKAEDYYLVRTLTADRSGRQRLGRCTGTRKALTDHLAAGPSWARAWGESSEGAEFIDNAAISSQLARDAATQLGGSFLSLFPTMPMSRKNVDIPFTSQFITPVAYGQIGDDPADRTVSKLSTAERQISAKGLSWLTVVDIDAAEDSYVDTLPLLRQNILASRINALEDAIVNGDTAGSHQDAIASWDANGVWDSNVIGGSTDHRAQFLGLRARALDIGATAAVDQGSAQDYAGFLALRKGLGTGHRENAAGLAALVSWDYYLGTMLTFSEIKTAEVFGGRAPNISGMLSMLAGVPIIPTHWLTGDLNASGVYDGVTTTKTGMILVNTGRFVLGQRRGLSMFVERVQRRGADYVGATERLGWLTLDAASTVNLRFGYNLTA